MWFWGPIFLDLLSCESGGRARVGRRLNEIQEPHGKTLDNNDLKQFVHPAVLVKTRIWLGAHSRMLKKTWSRSFLLKDFRAHNTAEQITGPTRDQRYQINFICSWRHCNSVEINRSLIGYMVISVQGCNLSCKKHVLIPTKRFPPHVPHWP